MKSLRCMGVLLFVLLSACDGDKAPAPAPKVEAGAAAVTPDVKAVEVPAPAIKTTVVEPSVHELSPNVGVVPVVAVTKTDPSNSSAGKKATTPDKAAAIEQKAPSVNARSAKVKADNADVASRATVSSKSKSPSQVVKETHLPSASLDLSLPPDMVKQMTPPANVISAAPKPKTAPVGGKPLLPKMFPDTESDPEFQLQGRLLSNEMQLQLRNESRRDVDGAALDFKFKQ
jgi:hypothetical protein